MKGQRIRIKLQGFDYRVIDQSALEIVETAGPETLKELKHGPGAVVDEQRTIGTHGQRVVACVGAGGEATGDDQRPELIQRAQLNPFIAIVVEQFR